MRICGIYKTTKYVDFFYIYFRKYAGLNLSVWSFAERFSPKYAHCQCMIALSSHKRNDRLVGLSSSERIDPPSDCPSKTQLTVLLTICMQQFPPPSKFYSILSFHHASRQLIVEEGACSEPMNGSTARAAHGNAHARARAMRMWLRVELTQWM
jgi:hypothetical protein